MFHIFYSRLMGHCRCSALAMPLLTTRIQQDLTMALSKHPEKQVRADHRITCTAPSTRVAILLQGLPSNPAVLYFIYFCINDLPNVLM